MSALYLVHGYYDSDKHFCETSINVWTGVQVDDSINHVEDRDNNPVSDRDPAAGGVCVLTRFLQDRKEVAAGLCMHDAYVQEQYLFNLVIMAKPSFGTSSRLPNSVMLLCLSIKMFIQGCSGNLSPTGHHRYLGDRFSLRGSTESIIH